MERVGSLYVQFFLSIKPKSCGRFWGTDKLSTVYQMDLILSNA